MAKRVKKSDKMTPQEVSLEVQALENHIDNLEHQLETAREELSYIRLKGCRHEIENIAGHASCSACKLELGWYCKDSPDHHCHYYSTDNGKSVELSTGEKVPNPGFEEDYEPLYETDDNCLFCGEPDERK